jgi:hypothetical protein
VDTPDLRTGYPVGTGLAALPEGAINARGRFSLLPASPETIAQLERLLKAATRHAGTSATNTKADPIPSSEEHAAIWLLCIAFRRSNELTLLPAIQR